MAIIVLGASSMLSVAANNLGPVQTPAKQPGAAQ